MSDGIDLRGDHTLIMGKKGTGKSNLLQYALGDRGPAQTLVYDVCHEHDALTTYRPTHRRGDKATAELGRVTESMVLRPSPDRRPDVFAVEELSRFCSPHVEPPEPVMEIIDMNRHYQTPSGKGLGFVGITRRPSQVHTDAVELADRLIIFRLTGRSDKRRLDDVHTGLGEVVGDLPDYHYVVVDGADYEVHEPVPERETTGNL